LAHLHDSGAPWFGCPPESWTGDGFIGPLPMPHVHDPTDPAAVDWGTFYARYRIAPFLDAAERSGALGGGGARAVRSLMRRLESGDTGSHDLAGPVEPPARLHGDLWSGNVMWTARGAVLIDPAAHGGHRETDLAMLALFGHRGLDDIVAGYEAVTRLAPGWRRRLPLHQLHPLLVHAALFGGGYGAQVEAAARALA
jgi:fructosamine-3-kinase